MREGMYKADFFGWTQQQAELLRAGKLSEVDVMNLAEEIEDMGGSEKGNLNHVLAFCFYGSVRNSVLFQ